MIFDHDVVEFLGLLALVGLLCFAAYAQAEVIDPTRCADLAEAVRLLEDIPEPSLTDLLTLRKLREWQREAGCPTDPEC